MRRFVSLSLPEFSTDLLRRERGDVPAALWRVDSARGSQWVEAPSRAAFERGVRRGMSVAQARAILGQEGFAEGPYDALADREALERLGRWAVRYSPTVAVDAPGGLFLDITGSERLYGSEAQLVETLVAACERHGFRARAAVASTLGCAWALARFSDRREAQAGAEAEVLGPLPVAALRLETEAVDALAEIGIERVDELRELARDDVPARFGSDVLLRLDQALGSAFEPLEPLRPLAPPRTRHVFEAPVELPVVQHVTRELLEGLAGELARRAQGALQFELELTCAQAPAVVETFELSRASADPEHVWALLEPCLERAPLGFGVEEIELRTARVASVPERQLEPWSRSAPAEPAAGTLQRAMGQLLDRLVARLGKESVLEVEACEAHWPESAFRAAPHGERNMRTGDAARFTLFPRPSRLFDTPEPIEIEPRDGSPPVQLTRRGPAAEVVRLVRRFGPERIVGPWWRDGADEGEREYYCVEDERGRWLWIARNAHGRWFCHGEWS